jgi:hypothetical protein
MFKIKMFCFGSVGPVNCTRVLLLQWGSVVETGIKKATDVSAAFFCSGDAVRN